MRREACKKTIVISISFFDPVANIMKEGTIQGLLTKHILMGMKSVGTNNHTSVRTYVGHHVLRASLHGAPVYNNIILDRKNIQERKAHKYIE